MEETDKERKRKPTLSEAMKDPDKHREESEQSLARANLEQSELSKLERIITETRGDTERPQFPNGLRVPDEHVELFV